VGFALFGVSVFSEACLCIVLTVQHHHTRFLTVILVAPPHSISRCKGPKMRSQGLLYVAQQAQPHIDE